MSDEGRHTWLVRLWYLAPAPDDRNGRLEDFVRQEQFHEHGAAHGTARRWANQPLPAGAVTPEIWIEERIGTRTVRVENWALGHRRSTQAQSLDQARQHLRAVPT